MWVILLTDHPRSPSSSFLRKLSGQSKVSNIWSARCLFSFCVCWTLWRFVPAGVAVGVPAAHGGFGYRCSVIGQREFSVLQQLHISVSLDAQKRRALWTWKHWLKKWLCSHSNLKPSKTQQKQSSERPLHSLPFCVVCPTKAQRSNYMRLDFVMCYTCVTLGEKTG